jgi:hypothetical protein
MTTLAPGVHDPSEAPWWEFTADNLTTVVTCRWMSIAALQLAQEYVNKSAGGKVVEVYCMYTSLDGMTGQYAVRASLLVRTVYLTVRRGKMLTSPPNEDIKPEPRDSATVDESTTILERPRGTGTQGEKALGSNPATERVHHERENQRISGTLREPSCDVKAQFLALVDPAHPKDSVWLSKGTPPPTVPLSGLRMIAIELSMGVLFTTNPAKAEYFRLNPTEDALANVLGYVKPKSKLDLDNAVIVQATDLHDNVITEMLVDIGDVNQARQILTKHGLVQVKTVEQVLARRVSLTNQEP